MWLQCVSTCVRTYVQYVSVYLCMCGRVKGILSALFVIIHRVLYLRRFLTFVKASCSIVWCCHCLY